MMNGYKLRPGYLTINPRELTNLGHHPTEKLEAIEKIVPPMLKRGQFQAPDKLIASLHNNA